MDTVELYQNPQVIHFSVTASKYIPVYGYTSFSLIFEFSSDLELFLNEWDLFQGRGSWNFFLLSITILSVANLCARRAVVEEFCQLGQCLILEHLNLSYRGGDVGTIFIVVIATEQKPNLKAKKHSCSVLIFLMLLT